MRRALGQVTGLLLAAGLTALAQPATSSGVAAPPGLTVTVTGEDVDTYPSYDASLDRFAIRTGDATAGRVEVTVTADDPAATVRVNGVAAPLGTTHPVTGLQAGDEVNVQVTADGATSNQSWIHLPAGFPQLTASGTRPGNGPVFLGLSSALSETGFETVVDAHGVPLHVREAQEPHDFRAHATGPAYTVFEPVKKSPSDAEYGYRVREYDRQFRLAGRQRLRRVESLGVVADDTDFHDVQYLPDGRMVLIGHHRDIRADGTPWLDAILQVLDARGRPQFTWSSKGHVDPVESYVLGAQGQDYVHADSVELQPDGDLVASFRNTGQVLRIATEAHDGFEPGEVVWRLGGERNEFTFVDDPFGGFCAQHAARILPDGHLLLFDNGSRRDPTGPVAPQTADMCPDPADPDGERIARPQSRIVEYALDTDAMTATLVWSHVPEGRYAARGGYAQRLPDDSVLAGWSGSETTDGSAAPLATRVTRDGDEVWALVSDGWSSYRAVSSPAPDRIAPRFRIAFPRPHAHYPEGTRTAPQFDCVDRGGSNLTECRVESISGGPPSAPGRHVITFTADDGAGNEVLRRLPYVIDPLRQPDLQVRAGDTWLGAGRWPQPDVVHAVDRFTTTGQAVRYPVRVVDAGYEGERFRMWARPGADGWSVRYLHGRRDLTDQLVDGLLTPRLNPDQSWSIRVVVRRTAGVADGEERLTWIRARSATNPTRRDQVAVLSRAR